MTTQTEITKPNKSVQAMLQIKTSLWPEALVFLSILALISAALWIIPSKGEALADNHLALESISARYQGLADLYSGQEKANTQRALKVVSARYQGIADAYAAVNNPATNRALETISARYQGLTDLHAGWEKAEALRALEIVSARYQGMADLYLVTGE